MKDLLKTTYRNRGAIAFVIIMLLTCVSFTNEVNACDTGGCGSGSGSTSSSDTTSSFYNELTQAPTMSMSGSNANTIVNASANINTSTSLSADGGLSFNGTCAADTISVSGTLGGNEQRLHPSDYRSNSVNGSVSVSYVHNLGEAKDLCLKTQRLQVRAQELALSAHTIKLCLTMIQSGIDINVLAKIDENYQLCPRIANEAMKGYHGRIAEKAVAEYRAKREANIRALGVEPTIQNERLIYMK